MTNASLPTGSTEFAYFKPTAFAYVIWYRGLNQNPQIQRNMNGTGVIPLATHQIGANAPLLVGVNDTSRLMRSPTPYYLVPPPSRPSGEMFCGRAFKNPIKQNPICSNTTKNYVKRQPKVVQNSRSLQAVKTCPENSVCSKKTTTRKVKKHPKNSEYNNLNTPADRFLTKCYAEQIIRTPLNLKNGSKWDDLSMAIWMKVLHNQQSVKTYKNKLLLWKRLYLYTKELSEAYNLYVIGSTMTGLGCNSSDVDVCLIVSQQDVTRQMALHYLQDMSDHLHKLHGLEKLELVHAKVPLLKFRERELGIDVDLNCNNLVTIRNTHLLSCYSKLDWRVQPLVVIVKLWAKHHDINNAKNMTISSYALSLMVIHFLQCGVNPPVLPCLSLMHQSTFSSYRDVTTIDLHQQLEYNSENIQPLGELLLEFFKYYTTFDYSTYAISVRIATRIPVEDCKKVCRPNNEPYHWSFLCVEEPFDKTNVSHSVHNEQQFCRIKDVFKKSCRKISATHNLDAIF